jgi:hypothetical protein
MTHTISRQQEGVRLRRVRHATLLGGYRDDEAKWPEVQNAMIDGMIRLEKALHPFLSGAEVVGVSLQDRTHQIITVRLSM